MLGTCGSSQFLLRNLVNSKSGRKGRNEFYSTKTLSKNFLRNFIWSAQATDGGVLPVGSEVGVSNCFERLVFRCALFSFVSTIGVVVRSGFEVQTLAFHWVGSPLFFQTEKLVLLARFAGRVGC